MIARSGDGPQQEAGAPTLPAGAPPREELEAGYREVQQIFSAALERIDGRSFHDDAWQRPGGGGGLSLVLQGDGPIEKAAVLFSAVWGEAPPGLGSELSTSGGGFYATGVSIIVHPRNPHAPTFHANLRFLTAGERAWFGGGADLTPHYLYEEDAGYFHSVLREVCARHAVADHQAWKRWCDEYFRLPHRGEARGVGGLFFDRVTDPSAWAFQRDLGATLERAYIPILARRLATPYGEEEERWQLRRRGRYAEFNLVWDRGTRFGLESGGRVESVLASLPPRARWDYGAEPEYGTREWELLALLRGEPREW